MTSQHWRSCLFIAVLLLMNGIVSRADEPSQPRKTENVLFITYDGLRWQELFGGADESLLNKEFGKVKGLPVLRERFWRKTPEERREALLPFFWSVIQPQGVVWGDPERNSIARVTNGHFFSYPGYSEILTGFPDDRIDSNDKVPNPNVTVLEWLHGRPGMKGRVHAVTSWDVFPYIINSERSGIPVNAGWEPIGEDVDRIFDELPHFWDTVRYDYFTFLGVQKVIREKKPRVMYVSFGETDDWAHDGRYDLYLDAARRTDSYIEQLWNTMQSMPQYAGKTSLVITTDHGRGDDRVGWKSHGVKIPDSEGIWIAVLSPDVQHSSPSDVTVTQSQVAATVADLLGEDYVAAQPKAGVSLLESLTSTAETAE